MQTPQAQPADTATPQINARTLARAAQRYEVLRHYGDGQQDAALRLFKLVQRHFGTSGGSAAVKLLLGLYNGQRFPFDLTDMRVFDPANLEAALIVLRMDASRTWCEIHVLLDAIRGCTDTQDHFEVWAYQLGLKGKCTKAGYLESLKGLPA